MQTSNSNNNGNPTLLRIRNTQNNNTRFKSEKQVLNRKHRSVTPGLAAHDDPQQQQNDVILRHNQDASKDSNIREDSHTAGSNGASNARVMQKRGSTTRAMLAAAQARPRGFGYMKRDSSAMITNKGDDYNYNSDPDESPSPRESPRALGDIATESYEQICRAEGVHPCPRFRRQHNSPAADLSNCLLSDREMKSICVSLMSNVCITDLDLTGNDLSGKGAIYLAEALTENVAINDLCLSQCNISLAGLEAISRVFLDLKSMKRLDISRNNFSTKHAEVIANVIRKNDNIEDLYLNGNEFNEASGVLLGNAIASNVGIKRLDLSWNHLRREGAVCMALKHNRCIEELDLSWNGLALEGCRALQQALPHNHTLRELDITCNRISFVALGDLLRGLEKNDTLKTVRINNNPITTDGAIGLMKVIARSAVSEVSEVDIMDIPVNNEFVEAMDELQKVRNVKVHHRDPNNKKITQELRQRSLHDYDPKMVLFEYMKQENMRLIDLFRTFDSDNSKSVSKTEMKDGFMAINMPITDDSLEVLFEGLDMNDNDELEYSEYKVGYRKAMKKLRPEHPNAPLNVLDDDSITHLKKLVSKALKEKLEDHHATGKRNAQLRRGSSLTAVFKVERLKQGTNAFTGHNSSNN